MSAYDKGALAARIGMEKDDNPYPRGTHAYKRSRNPRCPHPRRCNRTIRYSRPPSPRPISAIRNSPDNDCCPRVRWRGT